jgi:cytochrome c oxidase assembly protein subunit 15
MTNDELSVMLRRFAWAVLGWNLAVILWGAYVRASGSGAGCGSHWPLCNGTIVQPSASAATLIEYSHRITSGLALIAVVGLAIWIFAATPKTHPARLGAAAAVFFMLTEAALGAGLVLFRLVAENASVTRALVVAAHLLNTFLLLMAITLTAWWLQGGARVSLAAHRRTAWAVIGLGAGLLLTGISGAIVALGDTLFPSGSLIEGLRADLSPSAHFLIRLRIWHPVLAVVVATALLVITPRLVESEDAIAGRIARWLAGLIGLQLLAGMVNIGFSAPVWMQMIHLLLADLVWVAFVLLSAQCLRSDRAGA